MPTAHAPAKHGTGHFIAERVTSIALLVLMPWMFFSAAFGLDGTPEGARAWVGDPLNGVGIGLFLLVALYHMRLGVQVVIEDYIAKPGTRGALLGLNTLVVAIAAAGGLWALYQISVGG